MRIRSFDPSTDFFFIAGPCLVEGEEMVSTVARELADVARELGVRLILKGSYRKANRTSGDSFQGIGDERALEALAAAAAAADLPCLTDVHDVGGVALAARHVDVLQIPAFLCRQTELLQAAGRTGRAVNVKKGQFVAPEDMLHAVDKIRAVGGDAMLTERGTTFGYHNLVVDMRSLVVMRQAGVPVIYDATHSLQLPSAGTVSGGQPALVLPLARAAIAVGVNGVFFETHPDPPSARSDSATQVPLRDAAEFMRQCVELHRATGQIVRGDNGR